MTLRLLLASNLSTAAMAALLIACVPHPALLLLWCLLMVPYAIAMLWWLMQCDHIDYRMLPREPEQHRLIGASDKPRAHKPPRNP